MTLPTVCTGTYSNQTNVVAESDCDACPGGYYCETDGLTAPTGVCGEGEAWNSNLFHSCFVAQTLQIGFSLRRKCKHEQMGGQQNLIK